MDEPVVDTTIDETPSAPAIETPAPEAPQTTEPNPPTTDTDKPNTGDKETPNTNTVTEDITVSDLKFDGQSVTVTIPADMANAAAAAGLDAMEIAKELYGENGLSTETRNALNEAFGKWQVDAYLKGLDALNKQNMTQFKTDQENSQKAQEEAWNSTLEIMGGEDRWSDLDAYAAQNLSDEDLDEFNAVMKDGTIKMQQLMIKDLWSQYKAAGAPPAPATLDLEEGANATPNENGAITQAEYFKAFQSGEYRKDPGTWDARRKAGMQKGI